MPAIEKRKNKCKKNENGINVRKKERNKETKKERKKETNKKDVRKKNQ